MNAKRIIFRALMAGLLTATTMLSPAAAAPMLQPVAPEGPDLIVQVQADCYSIGQEIAEENGGTLAGASESSQNGQPVCVITVLIAGKDGQRPRRERIVVPAD